MKSLRLVSFNCYCFCTLILWLILVSPVSAQHKLPLPVLRPSVIAPATPPETVHQKPPASPEASQPHWKPYRIGVLLPLNVAHPQIARLAQETLQGLRLALLAEKNEVSDSTTPTTRRSTNGSHAKTPQAKTTSPEQTTEDFLNSIELVVRAASLDPIQNAQLAEALIREEQVIAIIGPLTRKASEAAAVVAQKYHIPLISLSQTPGVTRLGDFIFRNQQNIKEEIQQLVAYSIEQRKLKRFLILYPDTKEGSQKMSIFWDSVAKRGGVVVGVEAYKKGNKSFVSQFERLSGSKKSKTPLPESYVVAEDDESGDPGDASVPHTVHSDEITQADALFIPTDSGQLYDIKVLLPYLQPYRLSDVVLLGDSGWNSYSLIHDLEKFRYHTVWMDSFYQESLTDEVKRFKRLYEHYYYDGFTSHPVSSYVAYSYDTLALLIHLLRDLTSRTPEGLRSALKRVTSYQGVTGTMSIDQKGETHRLSKILTHQGGSIQLVQ